MAYNAADKAAIEAGDGLRFDVGDRIECNIGEWATGTVIKTWYREDEWPEDKWAAYQVKLDMGQYIYAPIDQDKVCRAPVGDSGPPPATMEPEPPREPMTWDEIRQWDTPPSTAPPEHLPGGALKHPHRYHGY